MPILCAAAQILHLVLLKGRIWKRHQPDACGTLLRIFARWQLPLRDVVAAAATGNATTVEARRSRGHKC